MKNLLFHNFGLKIAAVLLSMVLWLFVTSRGQSEMSLDVPIEFKNIPAGLEMVSNSAKTVSLNIRGQERFIQYLKLSNIRVPLDLGKAKKGEGIYYINRDDITLPNTVTVTNINPTSVKIVFEETKTKIVKVIPVIIGQPARGYAVKSSTVEPQTVTIEGIQSETARVTLLKTEPFDVTDMNETVTQSGRLDLTGRKIRVKNDTVEIKIMIGPKGP
jgi:YbbR domain-containing protein